MVRWAFVGFCALVGVGGWSISQDHGSARQGSNLSADGVGVGLPVGQAAWSVEDENGGGCDGNRSAELGAARHWGAGLSVTPFSEVNLLNGNLLTVIPLVSWDPVGPPVHFILYHNSLGCDDTGGGTGDDVTLGPGWRTSYSAHIEGDAGTNVTLVRDDGQADVFAYAAGSYTPPAGVFDRVTWDGQAQRWTLTDVSQRQTIFDAEGRLIEIHDSSGNVLTVHRDANLGHRIDYVASAADDPNHDVNNRLNFQYDPEDGRLAGIVRPYHNYGDDPDAWFQFDENNRWTFDYQLADPNDPNGELTLQAVNYPYDPNRGSNLGWVPQTNVTVGYEGDSCRIGVIQARDGKTWNYLYVSGVLCQVQDPILYHQTFIWTPADPLPDPNIGGGMHPQGNGEGAQTWTNARYRDRREHNWDYRFDELGNLRGRCDPLGHWRYWYHDQQHNTLSRIDELGHQWTATYGPVGNVRSVSSPLTGINAQNWTRTWQRPDPTGRPNFYRLTQSTDPNGRWVRYGYAAGDPTLVTTITEQSCDPNDPNKTAVTKLSYYGDPNDPNEPNVPSARGQLHFVTDANHVTHEFTYDRYGFSNSWEEGRTVGRSMEPHFAGGGSTLHTPTGATDGADDGNGGAAVFGNDSNKKPHMAVCCVGTKGGGGGGDGGRMWVKCEWITIGGRDRSSNTQLGYCPEVDTLVNQVKGCDTTQDFDSVGRPLQTVGSMYWHDDPHNTTCRTRSRDFVYDDLGRVSNVTLTTDEDFYDWAGGQMIRQFGYTYDPDGRLLEVLGPDGALGTDQYTYDELGRLTSIVHANMGVTYAYDLASRLTVVHYTDGALNPTGADIWRTYDAADRLTEIAHYDHNSTLLLTIDYTWNKNNTLRIRTEADYTVSPVQQREAWFFYDNRNRLIVENRVNDNTGLTIYSYAYAYDQLGNRTKKTISPGNHIIGYVYDTDWDPNGGWRGGMAYTPTWNLIEHDSNNPCYVQTRNNRLLETREFSMLDPNDPNCLLLRTVRYTYNEETGNVAHITVKDKNPGGGDPNAYGEYHDLWLIYTPSGTLWQAVWQLWHDPRDPNDPSDPNGYGPYFQYKYSGGWRYPLEIHRDRITDAWEFRFDSGRERYWARHYDTVIDPNSDPNDPNSLLPSKWTILNTTWTDYLAEQPYVDYTAADANNPVEVTRYLAGYGVQQAESVDPNDPYDPNSVKLGYNGDAICSTMMLTDQNGGSPVQWSIGFQPVVSYTAFGDPIYRDPNGAEHVGPLPVDPNAPADFPRYQYAGGWAYENGYITLQGANTTLAPITLQHVGWRWYQPGVGRFVQRDPIGIEGGLNCYAYAENEPLTAVDPDGLRNDWGLGDLPPGTKLGGGDTHGGRFAPGTFTGIGGAAAARVPKGVVGPGQSATKNWLSSCLIRRFGTDWGLRHAIPLIKRASPLIDALSIWDQAERAAHDAIEDAIERALYPDGRPPVLWN